MRTRDGRSAAGREALSGSLVGTHTPGRGRRLVDAAAHDRMPDAKRAGRVGGTHEVAAQQLVERVPR